MAIFNETALLEKIRALPPDRISEVEDFVDFLRHKISDHGQAATTSKLSEDAFGGVWNNPSDAAYDDL
jgi:hypothetical protein